MPGHELTEAQARDRIRLLLATIAQGAGIDARVRLCAYLHA